MDYFTHISGSRPKYHPADVVEWEETVEAVTLETNITSRPVMNSPADEAEARDREYTAPRQADSDAPCSGLTGTSSEPEARPVTATAILFSPRPESAHEARMGEVIGQGVARISGQALSGRSPIGRGPHD